METLIDGESKYSWEKNASSWEGVQEDDQGRIMSFVTERERSHRIKSRRITSSVRRGLIRYFVLGIDLSSSALEKDFRPSRLESVKLSLRKFIIEYFDQNPISQLSLTITRDRIAEKLTDLSGNPKQHEARLKEESKAEGEPSLENVVRLALNILGSVPEYGTRELLIIYNSLKSRDPGNILETIMEAKNARLRVSVICTAAELYVCRKLAEDTGGSFGVAIDPLHLTELVMRQVEPPPEAKSRGPLRTDFVYMGFPRRQVQSTPLLALEGHRSIYVTSSFICPRCNTRCAELPSQCGVCRLQLISSAHIARSHHHLFPVPAFAETKVYLINGNVNSFESQNHNTLDNTTMENEIQDNTPVVRLSPEEARCYGCLRNILSGGLAFSCPSCLHIYCVDCDLFIHDSLHNCPGC